MPIPIVIEKDKEGERYYDIYSRLLNERILFITGAIAFWQFQNAIEKSIGQDTLSMAQEIMDKIDRDIHNKKSNTLNAVTLFFGLCDCFKDVSCGHYKSVRFSRSCRSYR